MHDLSKAILKTLCYADVFDYPLTLVQLHLFLISPSKSSILRMRPHLKYYTSLKRTAVSFAIDGEFYFLNGRRQLVNLRKKRKKWSREKMSLARQVAKWLQLIPTVKMVAVTGALAMNNAAKEDDIDLLIVTSSGWLWTTRLLVTILVELIALRRRPADSEFKNKICLNMFLDEDHLAVPVAERDLFSAHEVAQMKALWSRGEMYEKFMEANRWVSDYLRNVRVPKIHSYLTSDRKSNTNLFCHFIESVLKKAQLWYMKSRRTQEVIKDGYIRFHPQDARGWILREYQKRLKKYGI